MHNICLTGAGSGAKSELPSTSKTESSAIESSMVKKCAVQRRKKINASQMRGRDAISRAINENTVDSENQEQRKQIHMLSKGMK